MRWGWERPDRRSSVRKQTRRATDARMDNPPATRFARPAGVGQSNAPQLQTASSSAGIEAPS